MINDRHVMTKIFIESGVKHKTHHQQQIGSVKFERSVKH